MVFGNARSDPHAASTPPAGTLGDVCAIREGRLKGRNELARDLKALTETTPVGVVVIDRG